MCTYIQIPNLPNTMLISDTDDIWTHICTYCGLYVWSVCVHDMYRCMLIDLYPPPHTHTHTQFGVGTLSRGKLSMQSVAHGLGGFTSSSICNLWACVPCTVLIPMSATVCTFHVSASRFIKEKPLNQLRGRGFDSSPSPPLLSKLSLTSVFKPSSVHLAPLFAQCSVNKQFNT